jgi:hypothetical protein
MTFELAFFSHSHSGVIIFSWHTTDSDTNPGAALSHAKRRLVDVWLFDDAT